MSKAVLVVDMPDSCSTCILCGSDSDNNSICMGTLDYVNSEFVRHRIKCNLAIERDDKCPLKQLPEKRDNAKVKYAEGFNAGWNVILEELIDNCSNCWYCDWKIGSKPYCEMRDAYVSPDEYCFEHERGEYQC